MDRVKTGIIGLDKHIEGGYPKNASIVLIGPPGCGKSTIAQQFVVEGLKNRQPVIYVAFDSSPEEITDSLQRFGKVEKEKLKFIDGYSWRIGESGGENKIGDLSNINELNITVGDVLRSLNGAPVKRGVFDSLSTLLLYADPTLVIKFIPVITAKIKTAGYNLVMILEEGVHDPRILSTVSYVVDGSISFKIEENKRYLRVDKMKGTKHSLEWLEFETTERGVVLRD
ncbi:MAG TPA: RAD55 family ATPase [archaeon]|nr:RAD55 family ATPase [archaeon]